MKTKQDIVTNWLPRYTGTSIEEFGEFIILVNFINYVQLFSELTGAEIRGSDKAMPTCTDNNVSIICFGMGSANAATVMDLLAAIKPKSVIFLGKCGGLKKKNKLGDFIIPIAAIRGEGASLDYFPPEVPALPAFNLQRAISVAVRDNDSDYWTGTVYTTNRRVWEHDDEFKEYLRKTRSMGIDMETATIFTVGFANGISTGALLLVSDQPMISSGIKTEKSDDLVTENFVDLHLKIGIEAIHHIIEDKLTIKHLYFDYD